MEHIVGAAVGDDEHFEQRHESRVAPVDRHGLEEHPAEAGVPHIVCLACRNDTVVEICVHGRRGAAVFLEFEVALPEFAGVLVGPISVKDGEKCEDLGKCLVPCDVEDSSVKEPSPFFNDAVRQFVEQGVLSLQGSLQASVDLDSVGRIKRTITIMLGSA